MQGLVVAKDNSADWPSPAQGEACVGTLHDLEVAVFATQLDDGLLTRPTWDRTDFLTVSYDGVVTPDPNEPSYLRRVGVATPDPNHPLHLVTRRQAN